MKITFLATGTAPDKYEFNEEKVSFDGAIYDFSEFKEGDVYEFLTPFIRGVNRIEGELYVTLCQRAPEGHWRGTGEWIDSGEYNPNALYIRQVTQEE